MRTIGIVGDSRGIGAALREQLLAQGHRVIGVSRSGVPVSYTHLRAHETRHELV